MRPPTAFHTALAVLLIVSALAAGVLPVESASTVGGGPATADRAVPHDTATSTAVFRGQSAVYPALDSPRTVRGAHADGRLHRSDVAVPGETLLFAFQSSHLNRTVARMDGPNTTARFFAALETTNATASVVQLNPSPERQRFQVDLRESRVRVVRDPATGQFWLVLDTANTNLTTMDGDPLPDRELDPGVELQFAVEASPDDPSDHYTARVRFVAFETSDTRLSGNLTTGEPLYASKDGSLHLRAAVPTFPGERVSVRLRAANGTLLDSTTTQAEPIENRYVTRLDVTLSLAALDADDAFTVEVVARNRTLFQRRGLVGDPPVLSNVTAVRLPNGSTRFTATVRYPDSGFLTVRAVEDDVDMSPISVPADERTHVRVMTADANLRDELYVVAWQDVDEDGRFAPDRNPRDEPWQVRGSLLETTVRVEPATPTPTATVHAPLTPSPVDAPNQSPTPTVPAPGTTADPTPVDGPGFGPVTVLVALVILSTVARNCD